MEAKSNSESKVEIAQLMMPEDANPAGNVHGGTIMKIIDQAAFIAAARHTHKNCVTASVDRLDFLSPVYIGNLVIAKASINYISRTSMEIGVRIEAECLTTGNNTHVGSAYLTYVALDEDNKPVEIPQIIPKTEEDKRRYKEGMERRKNRVKKFLKHKESPASCKL